MSEMMINSKFSIGQEVWAVRKKRNEQWTVSDHPNTITHILVEIDEKEEKFTCGINSNGKVFYRTENNIFSSIEEAEKECKIRNRSVKITAIENIKITDEFKLKIPAASKISQRVDEYKKYGSFCTDVTVNDYGWLIDGYSAYLVAKMLGLETLQVTIR